MFFWTKLLAFLPGGNFLRSTLGKIVLGVGLAVAVWAGFNLWLHNHDNSIRDAALTEFNQQQFLELERQREEYEQRIADLEESQAERVGRLEAERDAAQEEAEELINDLRSGEFDGDDDPSSPILQEAIRQLQNRANGG